MADSYVIAIVEDNDAMRRTTARLLSHAGHRIESFTNGAEFLASDLPGDLGVILLDMRMPGMDGLGVMRALNERGIAVPVLVLSGHSDVAMAVEAMRLGAIDFLEKPCQPNALLEGIRRARESGGIGRTRGAPALDSGAQARIAGLSDRQRAVLDGILKGHPNKVIAWELGLSIRTIEAYRAQMLSKLGARGTAEAVRMALAAGLGEAAAR